MTFDGGANPIALRAYTRKSYDVPAVNPTTDACVTPGPVPVAYDQNPEPDTDRYTEYDVTGEPPSDTGASQSTTTEPAPGVADTNTTADGADATAPVGVAAMTFDGGANPIALRAYTRKSYDVPAVNPTTDACVTPGPVPVAYDQNPEPDTDRYTEYDVTGEPPSDTGASQSTTTEPAPGVADTNTTADGTVATAPVGVAAMTFDGGANPIAFRAYTRKSYDVPAVNPTTDACVTPGPVPVAYDQNPEPDTDRYTEYDVTGEPPSDTGASQSTITEPAPGVADTNTTADGGDAGTPFGVPNSKSAIELVPATLIARTYTVYVDTVRETGDRAGRVGRQALARGGNTTVARRSPGTA